MENNVPVSNHEKQAQGSTPPWSFNVHLKDVGFEEKSFNYKGESISTVFAVQRSHSEAFFKGEEGYLHYSYIENESRKVDKDSFKTAGKVTGDISAVFSVESNHSEVFFKGEDGYLHYFYVEKGIWQQDDVSFKAAGKVAGAISSVFAVQRNHSEVFFKGEDGYLHYFYWANGNWQQDGESFKAAGKVAGVVSAVFAVQRNHSEVFFKGEDGYLHYFYWANGNWQEDGESFKAAGKVTGDISSVFAVQRSHSEVFFTGEDGYLHYYFVVNGNWHHDGEAFKAAGKVTGDISSVFAVQRSHSEVFFKGEDGYLHYYYVANANWQHDGISFKAGGTVNHDISAVFSTFAQHSEVFFNGTDGQLHRFFLDAIQKCWTQLDYPSKADIDRAIEESKRVLDTIHDLGGRFVRTDFSWNLLEPVNGVYRDSFLDFCRQYVDLAKERGIQIICILYQTPQWAKEMAQNNANDFYLKYKEYCKKIAVEMRGKVYYYQLWNEPNNLFLLTDDAKDKFAFSLDFPKMLHIAETGLHEAGYPYVVMLNFLINFVTELGEFAGSQIDSVINSILNPVVDALKKCVDLVGFVSKEIADILHNGIDLLSNLKQKFSILLSWKTAIQYFVDQNHNVNPNNNILIYGIDHYPGTWSCKSYNNWEPLDYTADIIKKYNRKLAVLETGFATWFGEHKQEIQYDKIANIICDLIAKVFIDQLRSIENFILDKLKSVIPSFIPVPFDELRKIIDNAILRDDAIRAVFNTCLKDVTQTIVKTAPLKDHTFEDQKTWIDTSIPALYNNNHYAQLEFINWYEVKDNGKRRLSSDHYAEFFEIAEDNFGILLEDSTKKIAYDTLKNQIHKKLDT